MASLRSRPQRSQSPSRSSVPRDGGEVRGADPRYSAIKALLLPITLTFLGISLGYFVCLEVLARSKARGKNAFRAIVPMPSAKHPDHDLPTGAGAKSRGSRLHIGPQSESVGSATLEARHTEQAGTNFCDEVEYFPSPAEYGLGADAFLSPSAPTPLLENVTVSGIVPLGSYHYFQLCVAIHPEHHHRVNLKLRTPDSEPTHATKAHAYNADLYISVEEPHPTFELNTWISADVGSVDEIGLSTYLDEFAAAPTTASGRGKVLYVGVFGRSAIAHGVADPDATGVPYSLTVAIGNVNAKALAHRSALRGGAVVRTGDGFQRPSNS